MNPDKKLSAIEQLLRDKAALEACIKEREKNLDCDINYIRDNIPGLLFSGITSMLMPSSKSKKNKKQSSLSGGLSIGKQMMPILWEIAQPFILTWGIRKAKGLLKKALGIGRQG
jgi:hypothetical protein